MKFSCVVYFLVRKILKNLTVCIDSVFLLRGDGEYEERGW